MRRGEVMCPILNCSRTAITNLFCLIRRPALSSSTSLLAAPWDSWPHRLNYVTHSAACQGLDAVLHPWGLVPQGRCRHRCSPPGNHGSAILATPQEVVLPPNDSHSLHLLLYQTPHKPSAPPPNHHHHHTCNILYIEMSAH